MTTLPTTRFSSGHAASLAAPLAMVVRQSAWRTVRARIAAFIYKCIDEHRAQRAVTRLETMTLSDRELRDIGLRRTDVEPGWFRESSALTDVARFTGI